MTRGLIVLAVGLLGLTGCGSGSKSPDLTPVEVVVTINGQPLPNAQVTFTPSATDLGSNAIAMGITDEAGRAKLAIGSKTGASIGENRVTVIEGPPPAEARSQDGDSQLKDADYRKGLKNRPIPSPYASLTTSDLKVEVKAGQAEYKLELKR